MAVCVAMAGKGHSSRPEVQHMCVQATCQSSDSCVSFLLVYQTYPN